MGAGKRRPSTFGWVAEGGGALGLVPGAVRGRPSTFGSVPDAEGVAGLGAAIGVAGAAGGGALCWATALAARTSIATANPAHTQRQLMPQP
jgi:hypothetical protein